MPSVQKIGSTLANTTRVSAISNARVSSRTDTDTQFDDLLRPADRVAISRLTQRRWSVNDNIYSSGGESTDALPSGMYKLTHIDNIGLCFDKQIIETDDLIILPDTASEEVVNEIERFWTFKDEFQKRGYLHKRGILLWGDPGSGKTSTIQLINKNIIENGGIVVMANCPPHLITGCLQLLRRIERDRRVVVIMEDFDTLVEDNGENEYLALLDGESQVDNVVFIATTNYPEKLDKRFIDRPSRFDLIKLIPFPGKAARRLYFETKEPTLTEEELDDWVNKSKGMSIAHLKEMIIANKCYGTPIDDIVKRLLQMDKRSYTSDDARGAKNSIGFSKK